METLLAIASRRDVKRYERRPIPAEAERWILDAGRLSGSGGNRQPWTFVVVEDPAVREELAAAVYAPENVRGAALVVALAVRGKGPVSFDAGRAAQSMLIAAWDQGIAGSPNGVADRERAHRALGLADDDQLTLVLTFGYPARPRDPGSRSAEEWSAAANRKPLAEVVERR